MPDSNSNPHSDSDSDADTTADAGGGDVDTVDLTAVLDRFEGDLAVLVLEAGGETVGEKVVDRAALPEDARHADAVLELTLAVGDVVAVAYDADETEERGEAAQSRFDRLSRRPPDADDEREETG
jgi:hypothetical protein